MKITGLVRAAPDGENRVGKPAGSACVCGPQMCQPLMAVEPPVLINFSRTSARGAPVDPLARHRNQRLNREPKRGVGARSAVDCRRNCGF